MIKPKNKPFGLRKKGITLGFDMVYWIVRIFFFTAVVVTLIFLIKMLQVDNVNVDKLQNNVINNRLIYAYDGISYLDLDSNRVYPGIINPVGLSDRIDRSMDLGKYRNYLAIRFELNYLGKKEIYYYNKDRYTLLKPLVGIEGPGGAESSIKFNNVLVCSEKCVTEPSNLQQGQLIMDILRPNS